MASLYRRGPIYWISYTEGGRRRQRSLYTDKRRIAEHLQKQIEVDLNRGLAVTPTKTPIADLIESFLRHRTAELQGLSHSSYRSDVSRLRVVFGTISPSLDQVRQDRPSKKGRKKSHRPTRKRQHLDVQYLEEITPDMIRRYMADRMLLDSVTGTTANQNREILHRLFEFAIDGGGYTPVNPAIPNPVAKVKRAKVPERTIRYLDADEIEEQLAALEGRPHLATKVAVYIFAGLRREELLWLTSDDIDLGGRVIRIHAKTVDGRAWAPKTRKNRIVPISSRLHHYLKQYDRPKKNPWHFPSPEGTLWDPDNLSRALRKENVKAGLVWTCLDYRHTFGSHLAQKGVSLLKIAKLMGNSYQVVEKHYAALVPEDIDVDFDMNLREDEPAGNVIPFKRSG